MSAMCACAGSLEGMDLGLPELLIIAVVVVVLFGSKRLPDAARSLGKSLRIFKTEMKDLRAAPPSESIPVRASARLD